jgi:hypothetical protein
MGQKVRRIETRIVKIFAMAGNKMPKPSQELDDLCSAGYTIVSVVPHADGDWVYVQRETFAERTVGPSEVKERDETH